MNITDLTPSQLRKAANLQEKLQELRSELNGILGDEIPIPAKVAGGPKKRRMSAAGRRAIAAAARARWAKIKGTAPAKPAKKSKMSAQGLANIRAGVLKRMAAQGKAVQKSKRKMTAAGRAKLSALAKARWKKARAAGKGRL